MTTQLLGVAVNDSGAPILPVNNPNGEKAFYQLFFETEIGRKLRPLMTAAVNDRVLAITTAKQEKGREITLEAFTQIIEDLFTSKDPALFPPMPEQAAVTRDERERNSDGTFKSEFQTFSEKQSAFECSERAKVDGEYAEWRRSQYQVQGLQPGTFTLAGLPERAAMSDEREQFAGFVEAYNNAPAQNTRPRGGYVTLDATHRYTAVEFERLLSRASRVGLV